MRPPSSSSGDSGSCGSWPCVVVSLNTCTTCCCTWCLRASASWYRPCHRALTRCSTKVFIVRHWSVVQMADGGREITILFGFESLSSLMFWSLSKEKEDSVVVVVVGSAGLVSLLWWMVPSPITIHNGERMDDTTLLPPLERKSDGGLLWWWRLEQEKEEHCDHPCRRLGWVAKVAAAATVANGILLVVVVVDRILGPAPATPYVFLRQEEDHTNGCSSSSNKMTTTGRVNHVRRRGLGVVGMGNVMRNMMILLLLFLGSAVFCSHTTHNRHQELCPQRKTRRETTRIGSTLLTSP